MIKKICSLLFTGIFICGVVKAADFSWHHTNKANLGVDGRSWHKLYLNDDIVFEGDTEDGNETIVSPVDPTRDNTITIPDAGGTVVLSDLSAHDYDSGTVTWTLSTDEIGSTVLLPTNAGGGVTAEITEANAIQGAVYVLYNNTGGTVTFKVDTGTGTTVTDGNTSINYVNATPDVVEISEN